jgi:hypothetical protein
MSVQLMIWFAYKLDYFFAIDIESLLNRLLKVCYVPATSAGLPRLSFVFFFSFFAAAINSTDEGNKAGGTCS